MYRNNYLFFILLNILLYVSYGDTQSKPPQINLTVTIYDHHPLLNSNFEANNLIGQSNLVQSTLNSTTKIPQLNFNNPNLISSFANTSTFNQFYFNIPGVNIQIIKNLTLNYDSTLDAYVYASSIFFPITGQGWDIYPNMTRKDLDLNGNRQNFHFCLRYNGKFGYYAQKQFLFSGKDDVWLYINGVLVMDLGGVHPAQNGSVNLSSLGLTVGGQYDFDLYYCQRHTASSTLQLTTDLQPFCQYYDYCGNCNGKGDCCNLELCDDGDPCTVDACPPLDTIIPSNSTIQKYCSHDRSYYNNLEKIQPCTVYGDNNNKCEPAPRQCVNPPTNCYTGVCNVTIGCQYFPIVCPTTDKCNVSYCDLFSSKCINVPVTCTNPPSGCVLLDSHCDDGACKYTCKECPVLTNTTCIGYYCDPVTKNVTTTDLCASKNTACLSYNCTNNQCVATNLCNDFNACTLDQCGNTTCNYPPIVCDDNNNCTIDSCNSTTGCIHSIKSCTQDPTDLCTIYKCEGSTQSCIPTPVICPNISCQVVSCDKSLGCIRSPVMCQNDNPDCTQAYCDETINNCTNKNKSPLPFNCQSAAVKGAIISSAAIAGIVIGGAVALAAIAYGGKKTYAYINSLKTSEMSGVTNNPLYNHPPKSDNPLYDTPSSNP